MANINYLSTKKWKNKKIVDIIKITIYNKIAFDFGGVIYYEKNLSTK